MTATLPENHAGCAAGDKQDQDPRAGPVPHSCLRVFRALLLLARRGLELVPGASDVQRVSTPGRIGGVTACCAGPGDVGASAVEMRILSGSGGQGPPLRVDET